MQELENQADIAISVISPVYNTAAYVEACIASCQKQTLRNIELVFVNDGSTDGSLDVLRRIARTEPRLRVIDQKNEGAASARNNGLDNARGKYVFFIDSDDYIPEDTALEQLYRAAEDNGVAIAGGSMGVDRDGVVDFESLHGSELDSFSRSEVVEYKDYQYNYDYTRYIYSRDLIEKNEIRFPLLTQYEDPLFFVEAMLLAGRFATIPTPVYIYRYGHQNHEWKTKGLLDRLAGMMVLLKLSKDLDYAKLHAHVVHQLNVEITDGLLHHTDENTVMNELFRAQALIDHQLVRTVNSDFPEDFIIDPLRFMLSGYRRYLKMRESKPAQLAMSLKDRLRKQ